MSFLKVYRSSNLNRLVNASSINKSNNIFMINQTLKEASPRLYATKANTDEPIRFSTSQAKTWDSVNTFITANKDDQPRLQPFIVVLSTLVLFIYFAILREPNEIDDVLSKPLDQLVPNIKEQTLRQSIRHYEKMGLDTKELRAALAEEVAKKQK
jgi:hypothetical protein